MPELLTATAFTIGVATPRSPEVIELCVRWYVTYRLSYRDISAMMAERDISLGTRDS